MKLNKFKLAAIYGSERVYKRHSDSLDRFQICMLWTQLFLLFLDIELAKIERISRCNMSVQ